MSPPPMLRAAPLQIPGIRPSFPEIAAPVARLRATSGKKRGGVEEAAASITGKEEYTMSQKERPGVMLYFTAVDLLRQMPMEDAYTMFMAIFDYARHGQVPDFDNPALTYVWEYVRNDIDRDNLRYQRVVERRRRAAEKLWEKRSAVKEPSTEDAFAALACK